MRTGLTSVAVAVVLAAVAGAPVTIAPPVTPVEPPGTATTVAASAPLDAASVLADAVGGLRDPADEAADLAVGAVLEHELAGLGADVSVAVMDVESGAELVAGRTVVEAASTVKVDIVATLLLGQDGRPPRQQRALAREAIEVSGNEATDALLALAGRDDVNAFLSRVGAVDTRLETSEWGRAETTATDRLRVLQATLGPDSLLDEQDQRMLRRLMRDVTEEQRIGVDAAADDPASALLKAGYLPDADSDRWYVSSMGEVVRDGRTYLVAVVSAGNEGLEDGTDRIEKAAVLAVDAVASLAATGERSEGGSG
ncbi:hypothetical protein GCM10009821_12100 [Aeromicrobium halocynthiae]|uniref:Beta-lactamase class A catalytic domain-containing protein n=1 Tax=Aeromicrobium halocynthiae TaxID=560557 RepID=A0ABN2VW01_9ACTN